MRVYAREIARDEGDRELLSTLVEDVAAPVSGAAIVFNDAA